MLPNLEHVEIAQVNDPLMKAALTQVGDSFVHLFNTICPEYAHYVKSAEVNLVRFVKSKELAFAYHVDTTLGKYWCVSEAHKSIGPLCDRMNTPEVTSLLLAQLFEQIKTAQEHLN